MGSPNRCFCDAIACCVRTHDPTTVEGDDHDQAASATTDLSRPDVEDRLRQTALYRPDLDLGVFTETDECAGYALFWYDPVTRVGLVEPLQSEEGHQRRGLGRHLLTAGLRRLVDLGAERLRISWEEDNPASSALHVDVGFVPTQRMHTYTPQR